ncbi:MAG: enoyl-CoA hydratase/isomerase family protein [Polyangia bacterium]|nr:enoyl-CoA hydratase/isomerase family protein [Polyangia bacterium]
MQGPARVVRQGLLDGMELLGPLHEWQEGKAYLLVDRVRYRGAEGVIFAYHNPPVHQMGNPALDAYLAAFAELDRLYDRLGFVILTGACDQVHAGGDLKESLGRLDETRARREALEAEGADAEAIDKLYAWADARIDKGFALYKAVRGASQKGRTVAVCGGGTRFGGSAEVPLMADCLVADSRAAMCFSEAQIGLIPGWGGVGRAVTKAGPHTAYAMAATCAIVKASDLEAAGLVDRVVAVTEPFPKKQRTEDPEADKRAYQAASDAHEDRVGALLLEAALSVALDGAPKRSGEARAIFTREQVETEVRRRADPETYAALRGQPLAEAAEAMKPLGRPLAPQSIAQLDRLFDGMPAGSFDEEQFIHAEARADGALYRDPRLRAGIVATLEQRVADFRDPREET